MKNKIIIYGLSALTFVVAFGLFVIIQILLEDALHVKLGSIPMYAAIIIIFGLTGWVYKKLKSKYEIDDNITDESETN